ncbi:mevalonate kinase [Pseudenhygromyxa sp. WMMC2535]|uniref:mevalonate kinase n=1 Tax=Pseudenhygromyxa sp. WMMC2535 TaxID=2712867 RepID=UPI0015549EBC|nr:mevalonate kinase [Pseudenhygromyxa sp. WMMC2535]NVB41715.1 mevalonate kinase [Pseudenhygromyxa sp. WMMC2535]
MTLALRDQASACGKIILLGEHSVVYGHPALAAGLRRGLILRARPLADRHAPMELAIPGWNLDLRLLASSDHPVVRACLEVLAHCDAPVTGWRIEGDVGLPSGAGLGSSAALSVALARLAIDPEGPEPDTDAVVEASMVGERIFHGTPSGLDSEVAARGGVNAFARGQGCEPVRLAAPLHLVVMPSGVPRQTGTLVAGVRARRDRYPRVIDPVLDACGALVVRARAAIESGDFGTVAELANVAQELLSALGVSHPVLDDLCALALRHGAAAAKLTGAGGGGCAFALCETPADAAKVLAGLARERPELAADPRTAPFAVEIDAT